MPVYVDNSPNKWTRLSQVLGGALDQYQGRKQDEEQQKRQQTMLDQKQQEIAQKIIQWYATADPTARARFNQLNGGSGPPGFEGGAFDPSQGEQNTAMVEKDFAQTFPTLPESSRQQGTFQKAYGAAMPSESVKLTNAQDVYSNPTSFDPQMQPRQQIEDKVQPSGDTRLTVGEQTRHNTAEESQTGPLRTAQTFEAKQKGVEAGAATGKIKAETAGIGASNKGIADSVVQDPQSYFSLPPEQKKQVVNALGRAPNKISTEEANRGDSARYALSTISDIRETLKKWQDRGVDITGPLRGRYEAAANRFGDIPTLPNVPPEMRDEAQRDIASLQEWMIALPIQETKALAGGRAAVQVIQMITSSSPSLSKSKQTMEGSLSGLEKRFNQTIEIIDKRQWGGKPPAQAGKPIDENTAMQFLQQANGDKDKARALAKAAGYSF